MIEVWFSPSRITFQREEMIWLIQHLKMLGEGNWPPNPQGSSYIDLPFSKRANYKAYFETPCQFAAEVSSRLDRTKSDGAILYWQIQAGITDYEDLSQEAKNALNYISGWRRRAMPYSVWKKGRKYYQKVGKK